ncbi:MAG: triphosphoribosyl-dephospho-CoA synthase [Methylococcaceae bacterium]|nr:triphosphoribosyl-dephospho-CoA synthase [Methylococcaceae bacterium]
MIGQDQFVEFYKKACICDVQAFKPGNVSVYNEGHDMTVDDFILSAEVSASAIADVNYSLGEKIYYAVKATRDAVGCNTNLGIILLCAPLCQAAYQQQQGQTLRESLKQVLESTSIDDANWVFKAITLAAPGGLGESNDQDVSEQAMVSLTQAMEIASEKDRIALQYITNYKDIFEFAVLRYNDANVRFDDQAWAASAVFTGLLSKFPDSHIERKYGDKYSGWVRKQIITVDDALLDTNNPEQLLPMLHEVDRAFKDKGINPGTTADLTVATVLIILMEAFAVRCTS